MCFETCVLCFSINHLVFILTNCICKVTSYKGFLVPLMYSPKSCPAAKPPLMDLGLMHCSQQPCCT